MDHKYKIAEAKSPNITISLNSMPRFHFNQQPTLLPNMINKSGDIAAEDFCEKNLSSNSGLLPHNITPLSVQTIAHATAPGHNEMNGNKICFGIQEESDLTSTFANYTAEELIAYLMQHSDVHRLLRCCYISLAPKHAS